ncbi:hypothetical protein QQM39_45705 [Streptomyces sp. DT2A-34]|uniref:hypothetical protein n=1 Tax=Streptomyces sp. DT2A-34 TaxID=3051182 RepID=UPI00265C4B8D|nr:hypothetical protein [Streptomyces sp. DT2A-34]MDO0917826.1 hypothetical protein [Streptomyces sp. DT2A-34]
MTPRLPPPDAAGPAGSNNASEWSPTWPPRQNTPLPLVTLVVTMRDEQDYMRLAFAAHQPRHGRITVHPTPLAGTGPNLAHDLIRALGKHLPLPDKDHGLPAWATNTNRSWRIIAAWILTLGISHLTICRAHRLSTGQWEQLLALSARTGIRLTLLCNGPIPLTTLSLLDTIDHRLLDNRQAAAAHWCPPPHPRHPAGYPWWQHRAPFLPREDDLQFRMPPQPLKPAAVVFTPSSLPPGPIPALPLPGPHQDDVHPHAVQIADRIHTRIAHPVHAACVAVAALTGYNSQQIKALHTQPSNGLPELPPWTTVLMDAARQLAALRGHPDAPNPLSVPPWEHADIDQALHACRLRPTPPTRRLRTPSAHVSRTKTVDQLRGRPIA